VQFNSSGNLAGSANLTFDGTTLTAAGVADSSLTSGRVTFAGASGNLSDSANLVFDGTVLTTSDLIDSSLTASKPVFTNASKNLVSTGTLGVDQGGTGLTAGTSGGILAYTAAGTLASSGALTQYGIVYGGGAGVAPAATAVGTATHVLTSNGAGVAPTFQALPASGLTRAQVTTIAMLFSI
jgi:hypothetical protein